MTTIIYINVLLNGDLIPFGEVFKAESQLIVVSVEFRITWNFRQEDLSDLKWALGKNVHKVSTVQIFNN